MQNKFWGEDNAFKSDFDLRAISNILAPKVPDELREDTFDGILGSNRCLRSLCGGSSRSDQATDRLGDHNGWTASAA